jgi:hypothetical protein
MPASKSNDKAQSKKSKSCARASSMNFFEKAGEEMNNLELICHEKTHDIGGT